MKNNDHNFKQRIEAINRKEKFRKRKDVKVFYEVRDDGLIVPVMSAEGGIRFPFQWLFFILIALLSLKTFVHVYFDEQQLTAYLENLYDRGLTLQIVAMMLENEPITDWLVDQTNEMLAEFFQ